MTAERPNKSLMRNLGEFFGHVAKGIKTDPANPHGKPQKREVRREVEEREEAGEHGERITLRRTTIEEVEIQPAAPHREPHRDAPRSDSGDAP